MSNHLGPDLSKSDRVGDYMLTYTATQWWPMDPRPEEIDWEAVAHHLATINRFGGAARVPYSVAEHSVRVCEIVAMEYKQWAIVHDAHEGLIGMDPTRPLKRSPGIGAAITELERINQGAVMDRLRLPLHMPEEVKRADNILLMTERRDVMPKHRILWKEHEFGPLPEKIKPWHWREAKRRWLAEFVHLFPDESTPKMRKLARSVKKKR